MKLRKRMATAVPIRRFFPNIGTRKTLARRGRVAANGPDGSQSDSLQAPSWTISSSIAPAASAAARAIADRAESGPGEAALPLPLGGARGGRAGVCLRIGAPRLERALTRRPPTSPASDAFPSWRVARLPRRTGQPGLPRFSTGFSTGHSEVYPQSRTGHRLACLPSGAGSASEVVIGCHRPRRIPCPC